MSNEIFKIFHLGGLAMVLVSLSALIGLSYAGSPVDRRARVILALVHGAGMTVVAVTGMALLAGLGLLSDLPGWAYIKIALWLVFGASMTLAKRSAPWIWFVLGMWVLGVLYGAYLGILKPV